MRENGEEFGSPVPPYTYRYVMPVGSVHVTAQCLVRGPGTGEPAECTRIVMNAIRKRKMEWEE